MKEIITKLKLKIQQRNVKTAVILEIRFIDNLKKRRKIYSNLNILNDYGSENGFTFGKSRTIFEG